jgi:cytochrome b involved in lipid metabolism
MRTQEPVADKQAWVIIEGQVFDVSKFHEQHPGGAKILLRACGKDATKQFNKFHNDKVLKKYTPKLKIGDVSEEAKL